MGGPLRFPCRDHDQVGTCRYPGIIVRSTVVLAIRYRLLPLSLLWWWRWRAFVVVVNAAEEEVDPSEVVVAGAAPRMAGWTRSSAAGMARQ